MFKDLDPILHSQLRLATMSLLISVKQAEFTFIKEKTVVFYNQILNGISMQEAFKNERAFHRDIIFVIEHGMNNSTLSKELADYADYLKESIEAYFHRSMRIIQPIILILISSSILSLYIAILFPMFQLMNNI